MSFFSNNVLKIKPADDLIYIIKENHTSPIVSLFFLFLGGIRIENKKNSGIINFTQKMLLKGTTNRTSSQIAKELELLGGFIFPFTTKDYIGISLSILAKNFNKGIEILADLILNSVIPDDEFKIEQKNILEAIERKKDDSLAYCLELNDKIFFRNHPYNFPMLGDPENIAGFKPSDLRNWYKNDHFRGKGIISIVGDISTQKTIEILSETFLPIPKTKGINLPKTLDFDFIPQKNEIKHFHKKRQAVVSQGFKAPSLRNNSFFTFEIIQHLLCGMGSRLFIELRDKKGLGYITSASYDSYVQLGNIKTIVGTSFDKIEEVITSVIEEVNKIKNEKVQEEELSRTKKYIYGLYQINSQRNSSQAFKYAYYELMGMGFRMADLYPGRIQKITSEQILESANMFLDTENYSLSILSPES